MFISWAGPPAAEVERPRRGEPLLAERAEHCERKHVGN